MRARSPILTGLILGGLLFCGTAALAQTDRPQRAEVASAERFASDATWRGLTAGQGYTDQARRMTDCLASDRRYDPRIDRIRIAPGVTRRCAL